MPEMGKAGARVLLLPGTALADADDATLARALIGVWLWQHRDESRLLPTTQAALAA